MMKDYGKLLLKNENDTKIRAFNETFSQLENLKGDSDIKSTKHMHKAQKGFVFLTSFDTINNQQLKPKCKKHENSKHLTPSSI